LRNRIQLI